MKITTFLCDGERFNSRIIFNPRFTWQISDTTSQKSYQIKIYRGKKTVYDSGELFSSDKFFVAEFPLSAETEYVAHLFITAINEDKAATKIRFRTALINGFDSGAKWITARKIELNNGGHAVAYFKRDFYLTELPKTAFAYVAGLGLYDIAVNGHSVDDEILKQPFTNYSKKIFYGVHNIARHLKKGENKIEIAVADGWYDQNSKDAWKFWQAEWKDCNKFIFQMDVGEKIFSDETWKACSDGVIVRSSLRLGEEHDMRKMPSFNDNAVVVDAPKGVLVPRIGNPIREIEKVVFKSINKTEKGYLYDFGRNIAGYISFRVVGNAGKKITINYGERVVGDNIDNTSNSQYVKDEELRALYQTDIITLKEGENRFKPKFVYHGFRFVLIEGINYPITEIYAHFISTDFKRTGKITVGNQRINRLQKMVIDSDRANYIGIPTDCPHREKNGWTGDMQFSAEQFDYNFDMREDMFKWLSDIVDCQGENGAIPCIVPTAKNIFGYGWGTGPAWDFAFFELVYILLSKHGDIYTVKRFYPYLKKYYDYLYAKKDKDGLFEVGLGDWCYPKEVEIKVAPTRLTDSLYFMKMSEYMAQFSRFVSDNALFFENKAKEIRRNIDRVFLKKNGQVADGGITALAAYLYFMDTDKKTDELITKKLVKEIETVNYGYYFGIFGNKFLFRVLFKRNLGDIAIKILENNKYPSFGFWIKQGATSMWEDFEGKQSLNHHMFGDVSAMFYSQILGADWHYDCGKVFLDINIPDISKINRAKGEFLTPNGKVKILWQKREKKVFVALKIPPDSEGRVIYKDESRLLSTGQTEIVFQTS